ncbi:hypothetical protein AVEN_175247-1 [Araneus ventricosus]|uniref:Uncharacterized protein n=1 Tax=Araneus ventricosus TaxID=182803 RepID=A0A4Y2LL72_ARAVE|nr:hypothetical protein AVEN_175247-1 [Araneus ventricosus]
MQAGKAITLSPQLVFNPLTGLEGMLSSFLSMAVSQFTSKGFTSLTAINAVVVKLPRHFTMPRCVSAYEEASDKLRTRMAEKSRQKPRLQARKFNVG